jgi:formate hydrogenlyase transcriptional activator
MIQMGDFGIFASPCLSETPWRIEGKGGAASILGLHPSTLGARMHKLGIVRPEIKEPY